MKTIRHIVIKELRDQILTPRLYVMLLVGVLLLSFGIWSGYDKYKLHTTERGFSISEYLTQLSEASSYDVWMETFHLKGFAPISSIQIWEGRFYDGIPKAIQFDIDGQVSPTNADASDVSHSVLGQISFASVIALVYSLIAILAGFSVVAGEREDGTLRMLIATAVPRYKIIVSKLIAGFTLLILPVVIGMLVNILIMFAIGGGLLTGDVLLRLALILLATAIYIATNFAGAVFISARCRNSQTALMVGLMIWIVMIFVYPGLTQIAVDMSFQGESLAVLHSQKAARIRQLEHDKDLLITELFFAEESSGANQAEIDRLNAEFKRDALGLNQATLRDLHRRRMKRRSVAFWLSGLSPLTMFEGVVLPLCNGGRAMQARFHSDVSTYNSQLQTQFFSDFTKQKIYQPDGGVAFGGRAGSELEPADVTSFAPKLPSMRDILPIIVPRLLLLIGMLMIVTYLSFVAFLRYDVR